MKIIITKQKGLIQVVQDQLTVTQSINDQLNHNAKSIADMADNLKSTILSWKTVTQGFRNDTDYKAEPSLFQQVDNNCQADRSGINIY